MAQVPYLLKQFYQLFKYVYRETIQCLSKNSVRMYFWSLLTPCYFDILHLLKETKREANGGCWLNDCRRMPLAQCRTGAAAFNSRPGRLPGPTQSKCTSSVLGKVNPETGPRSEFVNHCSSWYSYYLIWS